MKWSSPVLAGSDCPVCSEICCPERIREGLYTYCVDTEEYKSQREAKEAELQEERAVKKGKRARNGGKTLSGNDQTQLDRSWKHPLACPYSPLTDLLCS